MKKYLTNLAVLLTLVIVGLPFASASAACNSDSSPKGQVIKGIDAASDCNERGIGNLAQGIVTIITYLGGAIAVIVILISGFRYITSGGDSNRISSAKNTLIYALVGLVIIALAQIIVNITVGAVNK